jgi:hypothetical protein
MIAGIAGDPSSEPQPAPEARPVSIPPGAAATRVVMHGRVVWEPGMSEEEELSRMREAMGLPQE